MDSPARERLHVVFKDLPIGSSFQLVNTVMKGAMPSSPVFQKIDVVMSVNVITNKLVKVRPEAQVELVK